MLLQGSGRSLTELSQAAEDAVLVDEATVAAVRGALEFEATGSIVVKGSQEPVPVFRPRSGERRARWRAAEIIGRSEERARLCQSLEVLRDGAPASVVLEGEAGIGKSMLLDALEGHVMVVGARQPNGHASLPRSIAN